MTELRSAKIKAIEEDIDPLEWHGDDDAKVLVLGWGGTYGAIGAAVRRLRTRGMRVAHAHLRHLNPLPRNTGDVLAHFDTVIVPELNMGQLSSVIRAEFLVDARSITKVQGQPFRASELEEQILEMV
jgi:2-oxoglutarate ferredoxin oxidoreductase subunit alpha